MDPRLDSNFDRGCTTVSDCIVIECVPCNIALLEMVREDEKLTGGLGPLRSMAGRIECLLLDMAMATPTFKVWVHTALTPSLFAKIAYKEVDVYWR